MISGILFAVAASVGYGVSDVVSGAVVRRHSIASLALWAQLAGLVVLGLAAVVRQPEASPVGFAWGAVAGAVGAIAVLAFYTALQRGRTAVVTSIAGCGVIVPVLAGLVRGEAIGLLAGIGVVAAVVGVLVVAAASDDRGPAEDGPARWWSTPGRAQPVPATDGCVPVADGRSARSSVLPAVGSAIGFGLFFLVLERAATATSLGADAGAGALDPALVVALAVQVGALAVTVLAATRHTRACLRPGRTLWLPAIAVGLLDVSADLLLTVAVGIGPLAVVGPLASLDPLVAVLIATIVLRERIRLLQAAGVAVALVGIVLVAAG